MCGYTKSCVSSKMTFAIRTRCFLMSDCTEHKMYVSEKTNDLKTATLGHTEITAVDCKVHIRTIWDKTKLLLWRGAYLTLCSTWRHFTTVSLGLSYAYCTNCDDHTSYRRSFTFTQPIHF